MARFFMSSLLVCAQPATGNPEVFLPAQNSARLLKHLSAVPHLSRVMPASRLEVRPVPETVSCGIAAMDALTGGFPRGCLSQICGPASSGRTSVLLSALAAATQRQEICVLVDTTDAFDPVSAKAAGVNFKKLLWIRCGGGNQASSQQPSAFSKAKQFWPKKAGTRPQRSEVRGTSSAAVEQALRSTDLLLQSGGFGLVAVDFADVPFPAVRRIPLTSWFRFQRAVEPTPTVLLVLTEKPCAQTCAALVLNMQGRAVSANSRRPSAVGHQPSRQQNSFPAHAEFLKGLRVEGELLSSRLERKPAASVTTAFETKAVRAG
jgi:RecA DNA recombination protein